MSDEHTITIGGQPGPWGKWAYWARCTCGWTPRGAAFATPDEARAAAADQHLNTIPQEER